MLNQELKQTRKRRVCSVKERCLSIPGKPNMDGSYILLTGTNKPNHNSEPHRHSGYGILLPNGSSLHFPS